MKLDTSLKFTMVQITAPASAENMRALVDARLAAISPAMPRPKDIRMWALIPAGALTITDARTGDATTQAANARVEYPCQDFDEAVSLSGNVAVDVQMFYVEP